jgi:hypothetical protein
VVSKPNLLHLALDCQWAGSAEWDGADQSARDVRMSRIQSDYVVWKLSLDDSFGTDMHGIIDEYRAQ